MSQLIFLFGVLAEDSSKASSFFKLRKMKQIMELVLHVTHFSWQMSANRSRSWPFEGLVQSLCELSTDF